MEAEGQNLSSSRRGGRITLPFIIGTVATLALAASGVIINLTVYLIREFNIKSITATQISNVVSGSFGLFPVIGAFIADSFFGSFTVAFVSSCVSLLPATMEGEGQILSSSSRRGGRITLPFIIGTVATLALAASGVIINLTVYLIREFNIKSITATQISNVVSGSFGLFPVIGAFIADSFFGSFTVAFVSSCVSLLGTILFTLTAALNSLRPQTCNNGLNFCKPPSEVQYTVLYVGIALATIGFAGARFTLATLGANQFDKSEHQSVFFNWFFCTLFTALIIGATGLVYIEDNVAWALGFGLCGAANLIGVSVLLLGYRFYRPDNPQGRPLLDLARVLVASIRKWKSQLSARVEDYYGAHDGMLPVPGRRLRFFNRAALITDGDLLSDGSILKPWRLCTVQQVEDFKTVVGILPLWSTSLFLSSPIGIQNSMTILQALTMNRHLGSHFQIPVGSISVVPLMFAAIFLILIEGVLFPAWQKLVGKSPTPLQRIGAGHVFTMLAMAVSALVESKRLSIAHKQHSQEQFKPTAALSALWLFPQLALVGIGEAFHFPGQIAFYYQQFPQSLRSTSTAMISLVIGIAYYLSTTLIDIVRRVTGWLPDDINYGRVDNVYWMLVVLGVVNFGYYLACARLHRYQKV